MLTIRWGAALLASAALTGACGGTVAGLALDRRPVSHPVASIDLHGSDLREADMRGINLAAADLSGADLRGARLQGANLARAALRKARLDGAILIDADLTRADLTGATFAGAHCSRGTRWPAGFDPAQHGAICINP